MVMVMFIVVGQKGFPTSFGLHAGPAEDGKINLKGEIPGSTTCTNALDKAQ